MRLRQPDAMQVMIRRFAGCVGSRVLVARCYEEATKGEPGVADYGKYRFRKQMNEVHCVRDGR